ncbi:sugar transport protein MST4-like [Nymphaea colorata]|nr:sugar transport protein MST4-like [Nymphaea colorata]
MPAIVMDKPGSGAQFEAKFTFYVFLCCIMAAFGGLMFGYDIGISGGVTSMDDFLIKFFPKVYLRKHEARENNYCKYDNQYLQLFTSSLYMAALIFTFFASYACKKYGRRPTMRAASLFFLAGVILNAAAMNLTMLIIGRILLGIGVGFANNAVPLFLSEIAPARIRGGLNILFQLLITVGILVANLVNYWTSGIHPSGWRISLGLAGVPAILLCVGSLFIAETPTSLIQRGHLEEGKATLRKIRGTPNVDAEYNEICRACEAANLVKHPFRKLANRRNRPPLVIAIVLQVFQQFTGINAIMFYAPVLFQTIGFKNDASLLSSVITGLVNVLCTMVSVLYVDKVGRRVLLLEAAVQMLISQVGIGTILLINLKSANTLHHTVAVVVVILVCTFVSCFAWSWGPLGWLIPSETFPLETRAAGYSFAVSSNMLFTFIIAQAFLSMLCHMRAGIFYFFSGWIVVMGLFVVFFLPETKGIPIDEIDRIWRQHWYWKRYMDNADAELKVQKEQAATV